MKWSQYQTAVFDEAARNTQDDCAVVARAGSGKTTALIESLNHIPYRRTLLCAFNKSIQLELERRAPRHVMTRTLHSLGLRIHRLNCAQRGVDVQVETAKAREQSLELLREVPRYWRQNPYDPPGKLYEVARYVRQTAAYAKNVLASTPEDLLRIAKLQDVDGSQQAQIVAEAARELLRRAAKKSDVVDFDDMVWMPARFGYGEAEGTEMLRFDAVMVDECFPYETPVLLNDGSTMPIGYLVENKLCMPVRSYNDNKHIQVGSKIVQWHRRWRQDRLVRVVARQLDVRQPQDYCIVCTEDHRIWTPEGWVPAGKLWEGTILQISCDRRIGSAEVQSVETSRKRDRYVYDIGVERTQNYYAGGILVHNCQDLNAAQHYLVDKMRRGGRVISLLDDRQTLYSFRGADRGTIRELLSNPTTVQLPLPISYRCPRSVIRLAQEIVPDIEAAPDAPDGSVTLVTYQELLDEAKPGDFVLSRTNAPLMSVCLSLVSRNVPSIIAGVDFGRSLVQLVDKSKATGMSQLSAWLVKWLNSEEKKLLPEHPKQLEYSRDRARCLTILGGLVSTVDELKRQISEMFDDSDPMTKVVCSTVHKAKGLERDDVWMLSDSFPYPNRMERVQDRWSEENVWYVAVTRAKDRLRMVETPLEEILQRPVGQRRRRQVSWR